MTTTTAPESQPAAKSQPALQRQFVNFMFFRVDRAFRTLAADVKADAKHEFAEIVERYHGPMLDALKQLDFIKVAK